MSKREAVIHKLDNLKEKHPLQFDDVDLNSFDLYLDVTSDSELIRKIIGTKYDKFMLILYTILTGDYNDDLYKKEDGNVYAMRFSGTNNSRIYCKEIHGKTGKKKIFMSRALWHKSSQKNDKKNLPIIEAVKGYEFTLFEKYEKTDHFKNKSK